MNKGLNKIAWAIIISALAIIGIAAYFSWQYIFNPITPGQSETTDGETGQPETPAETLKILSANTAIDYWPNNQTREIYYLSADGIYKISSAGEEEKVYSQSLENAGLAKSSFDGTKAIIALSVFDTNTKTFQPLPVGTITAAWDPKSNNRIAYLKNNGQINSLNLLTLSDKKSRELIRLNQKDLSLEWVLPDLIYLKEKPSAEIAGSLWSFDIKKLTFKQIIKDENGLMAKWAPDGRRGLKFTGNGITNSLTLIDNQNALLKKWPFVTLPSKCALDNDSGYCAVPAFIQPRTKLPDEYLKQQINFTDVIYSINLNSGASEIVFENETAIDADNLLLNGQQLIFINRYNQKLYSLEL